jgi:hypothetical protein
MPMKSAAIRERRANRIRSRPFNPKHRFGRVARRLQRIGMARITVVHRTEYAYRNPVGLTRHRMMIRPDDSHDLRLHRADLEVDPAPAKISWAHDIFNNSICFLD